MASAVIIWPLCCEITVWAAGVDKFCSGGNYSPVVVLPSGILSPLAWSHCSQSGIPCWNGATGEADSPTKAGSNSRRQPSLSSYLPTVTSLSKPKSSHGHCQEIHGRCGLKGGKKWFHAQFSLPVMTGRVIPSNCVNFNKHNRKRVQHPQFLLLFTITSKSDVNTWRNTANDNNMTIYSMRLTKIMSLWVCLPHYGSSVFTSLNGTPVHIVCVAKTMQYDT